MKSRADSISPVVIVGAGPAGLTAAYQLSRAGIKCVVLEAADTVGGLARSFPLWGQTVDLGPHRFFSPLARVNRLWHEMVKGEYDSVDRLTRILYRDRFFDYPLRFTNVMAGLGFSEALSCTFSYLRSRLIRRAQPAEPSFEDWVVGRFGRRLFEIFFKTYSEKLWGIGCQNLHADFAAQRIRGFSFSEALLGALGFRRGHRTLADRFSYPHRGNGAVYLKMAEAAQDSGAELKLRTSAEKIHIAQGRVVAVSTSSGERIECSSLISTLPLTHLIDRLDTSVPREAIEGARELRFRSTIIIYIKVLGSEVFPDQWIYVHDSRFEAGRITNFSNWRSSGREKPSETILALEYWCDFGDSRWRRTDAEWRTKAREEILKMKLMPEDALLDEFVFRIPYCYPVYSRDYKTHLKPVIGFLKTMSNLFPIGRFGSFKYNNQDHSIQMGLLAADSIITGRPGDLWAVNSEAEYQESAPAIDHPLDA